jgi:hypothetical protein
MSTIDACRHFDNISIPSITWRLNTTTPQNKRDKPESSFSVDMDCQAYGCLTRQGYGKSLFCFPYPVKEKELYLTWLTNLSIEESFTSDKHKLVCEDHFETLFRRKLDGNSFYFSYYSKYMNLLHNHFLQIYVLLL